MSKSKRPRTHYVSKAGEDIELADYYRWIRQAEEAFSVLDENFNNGMGTVGEEREDQFSDLLCGLMHFAQKEKLNFAGALRRAEHNYEAEKRK